MSKLEPYGRSTILAALDVFKRRKFYILAPTLLVAAGVITYALRLPDRYRAQALLAVERVVSQDYIKAESPTPAASIQEQLRAIREILYSKSVTDTAIREFNLNDSLAHGSSQSEDEIKSRIKIQVEGLLFFTSKKAS